MDFRMGSYSDDELIELMKTDPEALDIVYRQYRDYSLRFLKNIFRGINHEDIFHDAVLVLYENVCTKPNFTLTASIQTYLNSVCRNMALKVSTSEARTVGFEEHFQDDIADELEPVEAENQARISAIVKAIDVIKVAGGKCYEILSRFYFLKQRMEQIAYELDYTNAENAKQQKARCLRRLKIITFSRLES